MKIFFHLYVLPFLAALVLQSAAQTGNAVNSLGRIIKTEVASVKQPLDITITAVGESQCATVKKLIGVDYAQVQGVREPDPGDLTLNFISRDLKVTFNLSRAAAFLPELPGYNFKAPLIIYFHGFTDNPTGTNFGSVNQAFLSIGEYNILGLDASSLIRWLYLRSSTYVRFIGERMGEALAALVNKGQDPKSIHLIGHSLGSHIAGFTGKQFTALTGRKVGRISGLDPAGPCFTAIDPAQRLMASDADFVDAIHTDNGVYGIELPVGHVDFFPNGGNQQPNCMLQTCSHLRVNDYYAESITNPNAFIGQACRDYNAFKTSNCTEDFSVMGYSCPPTARGTYYLRTALEPPYGLGQGGVRWENNQGVVRNVGNVVTGASSNVIGDLLAIRPKGNANNNPFRRILP